MKSQSPHSHYLADFVNSFHFTRQFCKTLLLDAISFGGIGLVFFLFFLYLQNTAESMFGGKTADQLQLFLLNGPTEQVANFTSELQFFLIIFIVGTVVLLIGGFLWLSYTRQQVWKTLMPSTTPSLSRYSRWCGLTAMLSIFTLVYALLAAMLRTIISLLFTSLGENAVALSGTLASVVFILVLFFIGFAAAYGLQSKGKVFEGISFGLARLTANKSRTATVFGFGVLILAILSLFLYLLHNATYLSEATMVVVNAIIFVLYLSWLRWYYYGAVIKG